MELEELEQEGDVNNSGVGGKKYNKKARQKEQKFVMGGEWIRRGPGGSHFQRQEEKRRKERRRRRSERSQNSLVVVDVVVVADRVTFED